jgi:DNA gyrase inhibitor GyrI
MAKLFVERSVFIQASPDKVYEAISDFHTWTSWSPWLVAEPGTKVEVREDGKYYSWEGDIVGAGEMTIAREEPHNNLDIDLMFLKPWKSKAKVGFTLKEENNGVRLSWNMESSLPFFLFWMKKSTEAFVGNDYERGLTMLKDFVEHGKVLAKLTVKGMEDFKGCTYIGIRHDNLHVEHMAATMESDWTTLMEYIMNGHHEKMNGAAFSIYHKWDMPKQLASYTACIPVHEIPEDLPEGIITGEIPATKVHVMHQKGPYRYIGNLWSAQYMRLRNKKFKSNKALDPMERYLNSPKNTNEIDLETEVLFPVKP